MFIAYIKEKTVNKKIFFRIKQQQVNGKLVLRYEKTFTPKIYNKRLIKFLEKNFIENVVLSKKLFNNEMFKNELYENNINIIEGKTVLGNFVEECIEKVVGNNKIFYEIAFLINDYDDINAQNIKKFLSRTRKITIVTNHKEYFKNLAKYCFEEYGLIIKITNDKSSSLARANLIINMDFPNEIINQYKIAAKAIIINLKNKTEIYAKSYEGINIVGCELEMPCELKMEDFYDEHIYESLILGKHFFEIEKFTKKNEIRIKNLIGRNGMINEKEIARFT